MQTPLDADKIGETRFGKDISIKRRPDGRLFEIVVAGGGKKPREFDGYFTRYHEAQDVINAYITTVKHRASLPPLPPPGKVEPPKVEPEKPQEDEYPELPAEQPAPVVQEKPKATLSLKK